MGEHGGAVHGGHGERGGGGGLLPMEEILGLEKTGFRS